MPYRTVENRNEYLDGMKKLVSSMPSIQDEAVRAAQNLQKSRAEFLIELYKNSPAGETVGERFARVMGARMTPWPTRKTFTVSTPSVELNQPFFTDFLRYTKWVQEGDDIKKGRWVNDSTELTDGEKEFLASGGLQAWQLRGFDGKKLPNEVPKPPSTILYGDSSVRLRSRPANNMLTYLTREESEALGETSPQPQELTPAAKTFLGMKMITSEKLPPGTFGIINNNFDPERHAVFEEFFADLKSYNLADIYAQNAARMSAKTAQNPYGCRAVNFKPKFSPIDIWETKQSEFIDMSIRGVHAMFIRQKNTRVPQPWKIQQVKIKGVETPANWRRLEVLICRNYQHWAKKGIPKTYARLKHGKTH